MSKMSEESSPGSELLSYLDGLRNSKVSRMGSSAQSAQYKCVQAGKQSKAGRGYLRAIRAISEAAQTVAQYGLAGVNQRDWLNGLAEQFKRSTDFV